MLEYYCQTLVFVKLIWVDLTLLPSNMRCFGGKFLDSVSKMYVAGLKKRQEATKHKLDELK